MAESTKRRGKKGVSETKELPEDVITEVLTCLPVKSLLRFRCVSKRFLTLIDGHHFIKRHLNRSLLTKTNHKLILQEQEDKIRSFDAPIHLYSVDLDKLDQALEFDHPCGTDILGSVNGILCLSNADNTEFVFWNFATRRYHKLPYNGIEFLNDIARRRLRSGGMITAFGFGYDSVSDDYKLFRHFQYHYGDNFESYYSETKVYSLRSNSWQRIYDFPFDLHNGRTNKVIVCGALHWFASHTSHMHGLNETELIVAFDLATNEHRVVDHPEFLKKGHKSLTKLEGRLCVPRFSFETGRVDLWVMKDYGVKESWSKWFSIFLPQFKSLFHFAISLTLKSGTEIMLLQDYRKLFWYCFKEGTMGTIDLRGCPDKSQLQVCVESLVPLSGRAEDYINKKDGKRKTERERRGEMMKEKRRSRILRLERGGFQY